MTGLILCMLLNGGLYQIDHVGDWVVTRVGNKVSVCHETEANQPPGQDACKWDNGTPMWQTGRNCPDAFEFTTGLGSCCFGSVNWSHVGDGPFAVTLTVGCEGDFGTTVSIEISAGFDYANGELTIDVPCGCSGQVGFWSMGEEGEWMLCDEIPLNCSEILCSTG